MHSCMLVNGANTLKLPRLGALPQNENADKFTDCHVQIGDEISMW